MGMGNKNFGRTIIKQNMLKFSYIVDFIFF